MQKSTSTTAGFRLINWGALILSLLLGSIFCWRSTLAWRGAAHWILPILSLAACSAALSQAPASSVKPVTAYRFAVLISMGTAVGCWVGLSAAAGELLRISGLVGGLAAGLSGSMAASWVRLGFSDEAEIPPPEVAAHIQSAYRHSTSQLPQTPPSKRGFDILLAFTGTLLSTPLWLLVGSLIWLQDPGPILFIKHSTGLHGKPFRQYKFRTMTTNAQPKVRPLAGSPGPRVLRGCAVLRRTALDELPQLVNILRGEMSFVGPRPLRSLAEVEHIHQISGYLRRFDTLPGLAGLAQVCGTSQTPARNKLRYETVYARNAGLLFDIKLIVIACLLVFYLRWKKSWDGRIPRSWLRWGSKRI